MKRFIIFSMIFLGSILANAQSLKLVRTDVDTVRSSFVTATYIFGIDIKLENVKKCVGLSFDLKHDLIQYVTFSQLRYLDFGKNSTLTSKYSIDNVNKTANISLAVSPENPFDTNGVDNPKVVHLEFAVSQTAPHNSELTLTFSNLKAVIITASGRSELNIVANPVKYKVHSFINVWPGDANNDGVVNSLDWIKIPLFLSTGTNSKQMRTYKRQNPSTYWTAQRVLAWDSVDVTYADCDGNGKVTTTDMLVVTMNFNKTHTGTVKKDNEPEKTLFNTEYEFHTLNSITVPFQLVLLENTCGVTAKLNLNNLLKEYKFLGAEPGNALQKDDLLWYDFNEYEQTLEFAVGKLAQGNLLMSNCNLINLIIEPKDNISSVPLIELISSEAITSSQRIYEPNQITIVDENITVQPVIDNSERIIIKTDNYEKVEIIDINGRTVDSYITGNNSKNDLIINKSQYSTGIYLLVLKSNTKTVAKKFIIN